MRLVLALALALVWLLGAGPSSATSVAFDLRGLSTEQYRRIDGLGLERKVALRLVQEGFAVVAFDRGPDVAVRASLAPEGLELAASNGTSSTLRVTVAMNGPAAEWQLEVAHKVSEMARTLEPTGHAEPVRAEPVRSPTSASRRAASESVAIPAHSEVSERPGTRWELALGAGAVFREGGSAPLAGVMATSSRGRLRLYLEVFGARSEGTGIEIWESQGSAGVGFAIVEGAAGIEVGLAAGAVLQRYSLTSQWASDGAGTRASAGFWAPLHLRWVASRRVVLSARPAVGLSRPPVHTSQGATLWSRGAVRFETVLALAWAF